MISDNIVYKQIIGTTLYTYDTDGFINMFNIEDADNAEAKPVQTVYCNCKSRKDFEMEIMDLHFKMQQSDIYLDDE